MNARLIHAALIAGQLLFLGVTLLSVAPSPADRPPLPAFAVPGLIGVGLAASAIALVLRRRVPRRPTDASADLFWTTAAPRALPMWSVLEGAGLAALAVFFSSGVRHALIGAAIPMAMMIALNPWYLERR